jgi:hypothetical protein
MDDTCSLAESGVHAKWPIGLSVFIGFDADAVIHSRPEALLATEVEGVPYKSLAQYFKNNSVQ